MFIRNLQILALTFILMATSGAKCVASTLEERLQQDFSPLEATVTAVSGNQVILDAGSSTHVSIGDLFSIFQKGRPFYLPETHKIIGYERKKSAVCKISSVSDDTSTCTIIYQASPPSKGNLAIRYGELKAAFFIEGKPVAPELPEGSLKDMLPWFKWLEPASGPSPVPNAQSMRALGIDILFQVSGDDLRVFGPGMEKLRSYKLPPSFITLNNQNVVQGTRSEKNLEHGIQGIELFDFHRAKLIGRLDKPAMQVSICDLDGDGQLEIIYLLHDRICIAPYRHQGNVTSLKFKSYECVCNFSLLERSGWICINAAIDQAGLNSKLLKYEKGNLKLVQDHINLWLSFLDTDCNGQKDTLLGQSYERARFRGKKIFRLMAHDSGIEYLEQADYPGDFNINSAIWADLDHQGCSLFYVSFDGFFKAFNQGHHIWSSLKPVVREEKCCGPATAQLVDLTQTNFGESGIIFNGTISLPRDRLMDSLILFSHKGHAFALYQAEVNLEGKICGISIVGTDVIMATLIEIPKEQKLETALYEFKAR